MKQAMESALNIGSKKYLCALRSHSSLVTFTLSEYHKSFFLLKYIGNISIVSEIKVQFL